MKNITETSALNRAGAWAICHKGDIVGKILAAFPNDGAGTLRVSVWIWQGDLQSDEPRHGKAKGYGYDKISHAIHDAFFGTPNLPDFAGRGMGAVEYFLEDFEYSLFRLV